jgi:molecular chaperone GrpE (heat shock protein)
MDVNELSEQTVSQLPDENVEKLEEILLNTREQCQMMDQMKKHFQVKDELIDKLHKELEYYKQEQADRFVDQLMKALIKVRNDMKKQISSEKWSDMIADELRKEYTYSFEDLTDLLEQQNIDPYESSEGEVFDASRHQVFKVEPTDDESLDKKIKKSVNEGYVKGDKILMAERVIVYQYKEQ